MPRSISYQANIVIKACFIILVSVISFSLLHSLDAKAQADYYHKDFKWSYQGYEWTWSLDIPKSLYYSYKKVPVSTRTSNGLAGYGLLTTTNDYYLQIVAGMLNETALREGFDTYDEVSFVLAFVQSLPYTSDSVTSSYDEYPRFPVETLVDGGGDCEDTAILFATITLIMNYGTVYINPPRHYAVGVWGEDLPGYYFTYNNRNYYYCETTGDGFEIGEIPSEYSNVEAYIYEINEYQQYNPGTSDDSSDGLSGFLGLSIAILAVVVVGTVIAVTIVYIISASNRKAKSQIQATSAVPEESVISRQTSLISEGNKFCRYCGSNNEVDAVYCEKCGRNIK